MINFFRKKIVYIEINEKCLLIARLKKKGNKFIINNPNCLQLNKQEFLLTMPTNSKLFNLSSIYLHIKKYLNKNKLNKAYVYVSMPQLNNSENNYLPILQLALCISKTGLKIKKIINKSLIKKDEKMFSPKFFHKKEIRNNLNFFAPFKENKNKSPFKWIFYTLASLSILLVGLFMIQQNKNIELDQLTKQNLDLTKLNAFLEKKVQKVHEIQASNNTINKDIESLNKLEQNLINSPQILSFIAENISSNCFLENIKIDRKNIENSKSTQITITGKTKAQNDALLLAQKLRACNLLNKIQLSKIQKTKTTELPQFYDFVIIGELK